MLEVFFNKKILKVEKSLNRFKLYLFNEKYIR